ncbi:hypothetical protein QYF61_014570 [Mycteria americana]|uniref:RNase H type-1 domain-containing protein n=1 Tax=Mycteria americana TaxID=33587 RepID=A0AAN7NT49_MYCAM|nr:hypothetical protein QYF61_014570 [Mycteria americana]
MVANALWGWLQQWKQTNWQNRGKPTWAAALWQDIAARVENLVVKVSHVDAHVPKGQATEEHKNNKQVDQPAKIEVAQVDLDWQHKGELFIARWAHDTPGHQGRDATYRWARDRGVDLTMDTIAQVIYECETCCSQTSQAVKVFMVHKKLGGDTAGTADHNWSKGYSIPYGVMVTGLVEVHSLYSTARLTSCRGASCISMFQYVAVTC